MKSRLTINSLILASVMFLLLLVGTLQSPTAIAKKKPSLTFYMTDWCPYCAKAKRFLSEHDISYHECNIERNMKCKEAFHQEFPNSGVPVLSTGKKHIVGYSWGGYSKFLLQNGYIE